MRNHYRLAYCHLQTNNKKLIVKKGELFFIIVFL
ncbi:hypothetical protein PT2222_140356 [Paraburkholderia tropica]